MRTWNDFHPKRPTQLTLFPAPNQLALFDSPDTLEQEIAETRSDTPPPTPPPTRHVDTTTGEITESRQEDIRKWWTD